MFGVVVNVTFRVSPNIPVAFWRVQRNLNWQNVDVRNEIYDMMRWWLDMGVDGFRMDAIVLLAKRELEDVENPVDIKYLGNNPGIHDYLQEMYNLVLKHYSVFTVGEIPFITAEEGILYVGEDRNELNTLFHFQVCDMMETMDLIQYKSIQAEWYYVMWGKGWNSQFLNNHDHTRQVTRFGNDSEYRIQSAKLLATMLHTLPGMPYIYQGEEIGMTGVDYDSIDDYDDIMMRNKYFECLRINPDDDKDDLLRQLKLLSRDNSRSPMQWHNRDSNAGFTKEGSKPWIQINPNYKDINVESSIKDRNSVFWYYRRLISLRKRHPVMVYGDYHDYDRKHPNIYIYRRSLIDEFWLIVLNHCDDSLEYPIPKELSQRTREILLANYDDADKDNISLTMRLRPHEARIYIIMSDKSKILTAEEKQKTDEAELEENDPMILPM
ncbi:hypothetical protein GJ496_008143 [Pomphorhynchus laevis]|nr:hypothetical protein GJ496_008143 [Pomphorhynchus laevis]